MAVTQKQRSAKTKASTKKSQQKTDGKKQFSITEAIVGGIDVFMAWLATSLGQSMESYCAIETADNTTLVAHDGSLIQYYPYKRCQSTDW